MGAQGFILPHAFCNASKSRCGAPSPEDPVEEDHSLHIFFDSLKPNFTELDTSDSETGLDVDLDDWEELHDEQLFTAMSEMDNKLQDPDWVSEHLRKKADLRAKLKTSRSHANSTNLT
ncbi:hypothetical protein AZE42_13697 [Rhizopogon vesiculosus]|uniref:Uncharacterized protein n=1 Tax=Rhizopogon vesiculosus TaxID=180088 RepID=A0A1J8QNB3_9AGAM|nr:hypothetical protein AZE42_13697 [Rhizopogon vesiculosus]